MYISRKIPHEGIPLSVIVSKSGALLESGHLVDRFVKRLCPLDRQEPDAIAFCKRMPLAKFHEALRGSSLAAVIVPTDLALEEVHSSVAILRAADPYEAFVKLIELFYEDASQAPGVHPTAVIDPSVRIGNNVSIGAFTWIGADVEIEDDVTIMPHVSVYPEVRIGAGTLVHSQVVIRERSLIGKKVVLQSGAVIGTDGFGYVPDKEIGIRSIPQIGNTVIADRVDIGANSCIDRATVGSTTIGLSTKIDNLVQIGHNNQIGKFCFICGVTGIAGSCKIGDRVTIGGHVGIRDHAVIDSEVRLGGKSGVIVSHLPKGDYAGYPTMDALDWHRTMKALSQLRKKPAKSTGQSS